MLAHGIRACSLLNFICVLRLPCRFSCLTVPIAESLALATDGVAVVSESAAALRDLVAAGVAQRMDSAPVADLLAALVPVVAVRSSDRVRAVF
jgi:hypothetical protein